MLIGSAPVSTSAKLNSTPLGFHDVRSCKSWLQSIPLSDPLSAQRSLLSALQQLNDANNFTPLERLTSLELTRERVSYFLGEQRRRHWGRTIPLSSGEVGAWQVSLALVSAMEAGYRRCWLAAQAPLDSLEVHAALICQRITRYIGLHMLLSSLLYRPILAEVWARLHLHWREVDAKGLARIRVRDSIGTVDCDSSVEQAYVAILLGQLADTHSLTPREIDFTDSVLRRLGHKVSVSLGAAAGGVNMASHALVVDLDTTTGARFTKSTVVRSSERVLNTVELSRSLRARFKKLSEGASPESVQLPPGWSADEARRLLLRLHGAWCGQTTSMSEDWLPSDIEAAICVGLTEAHFFITKDLFAQPNARRELSRDEIRDLAIFGRVLDTTNRARQAVLPFATEFWRILGNAGTHLRIQRGDRSSKGLAIGSLLGVRVNGAASMRLGVIRRLTDEAGAVTAALEIFCERPIGLAVRAVPTGSGSAAGPYVQGVGLPIGSNDELDDDARLLLPANMAQAGREIEVVTEVGNTPQKVRVAEVLFRGIGFDYISLI